MIRRSLALAGAAIVAATGFGAATASAEEVNLYSYRQEFLIRPFLEKFEAGIVLKGYEVKAIKLGHVSLKGSYVTIKNEEAYLINAHISPYQAANMPKDYDSTEARKLLLKRSELKTLLGKAKAQGLTLIPLSLYNKKGKIKIGVGVGRGKRKHERRETIKRREASKEMGKELKYGR